MRFGIDILEAMRERFKKHDDSLDYVYLVRKSGTQLYFKEDYTFSKLGEGLGPLLFRTKYEAETTIKLVDPACNFSVIETYKYIVEGAVNISRSMNKLENEKNNFHKFEIDDRLSINKNRKANGIEPITRRCANCNHSERGDSFWYCFEYSRFMSPNGSCESWGGRE